jgi:hypothetical protein
MLDSAVLMSYLQWEGLAIFIGLSGLFATGIVGLNHRLRKPEVIGFVSLIDHYDVQFKVVGTCPTYPTSAVPTTSYTLGTIIR